MKQSTIKKREKQLLYLLKQAIEHTDEAVMITNANLKYPGPKIIYVNKALCEMTGYSRNEFIGKSPRILQGTRTNDILDSKISERLQTGKSYYGYVINYRKDGSEIHVEINIAPIFGENNKITHYISIHRDITHTIKKEIEKDEILGELDHGMKTHLATVKGYLQMIEKKSLDAKITQYIQYVELEVEKILQLLINIKETRNSQSNSLIQVERFDIDTLIVQAIKNVKVSSNSHKIARRGKVNHYLQVDAFRINQVLELLLNNAIKYSPDSDKVIVRAKKDSKNILISIEDTGMGIPPELQDKIFQRYYMHTTTDGQLDSKNGFGLYLASEIIKAHGGEINVQSTPGKGTIFYLSLPLEIKNIKKNMFELFNESPNGNGHSSPTIANSLLKDNFSHDKFN